MPTKSRTSRVKRTPGRPESELAKLRRKLERYVREHPLKALGQAAALGCALQWLPVRSILAMSFRLASPLLGVASLWKAYEGLEETAPTPR